MTDVDRERWARLLDSVGWTFVVVYLLVVATQIKRASAITTGSFEDGVWGQRIEFISFASLPQNYVTFMPAAASAVIGAVVATGTKVAHERWSGRLIQVVAGIAYMVVVLATVGIVAVFFRTPDGLSDFGAVLNRVGGILMSVATIRLCNAVTKRPESDTTVRP